MINKKFNILLLFLTSLLGESCRDQIDIGKAVEKCWSLEGVNYNQRRIARIDIVTIWPSTLYVPSRRCKGTRMQAVKFSHSARETFNSIEANSAYGIVALSAEIDIRPVNFAASRVVEVEVYKIRPIRLINKKETDSLLLSLRI